MFDKVYPASTTKIMTCILALENAQENDVVKISAYAASMPRVKLGVTEGEYYYMGDLMYRKGEKDYALGLLVKSKELASQYVPTYDLMGDMLAVEDPVAATANYMVAKKLDPAHAAKYDAKIQMMRTEQGREKVLAARFFPR